MNYVQKLKRVTPRRIHPMLGEVLRRVKSRPAKTSRQKRGLVKDPTLLAKDRQLLSQIESRISPGDGMYTGDARYFRVGLSAIHCIEEALAAADIRRVDSVLDFPCGYGRVLRFLQPLFPQASFTASDLDHDAVDFCSRVLRANGVYSEPDPTNVSLGRQFDLIWCGSLVTHLDEDGIRALLAFFSRHLSPEGILIFTAHSEEVIRRMLTHGFDYGIPQAGVNSVIEGYRSKGIGFVDYPHASRYGISLTATGWLHELATELQLKEVYFQSHGWDHHQDVYGWVNSSAGAAIDG